MSPDAAAKACLTLAASMDKEGYEVEAICQYERARTLDPRLRVSRKLAVLYDRIGQQQAALTEYQAALEQAPHDPDLLNNLGYFYYNWGKLPEAEEKLLAALALNPKLQRAWNNLGLVYAQQGRTVDSLQAFQKVVSEAEAHSNLAFILTTQGKVAEAKTEYPTSVATGARDDTGPTGSQQARTPRQGDPAVVPDGCGAESSRSPGAVANKDGEFTTGGLR